MIKSKKQKSKLAAKRKTVDGFLYLLLAFLSLIWIMPLLWLLMTSFRGEIGAYTPYIIPKTWTLKNYFTLFTGQYEIMPYGRWFLNTLVVSVCTCVISTLLTIFTAYAMSKLRFRLRRPFMILALVLGMFPGFLSMIAVYNVLVALNIDRGLFALILVYSSGAGMNFFITKGYLDTISNTLGEAARIDGATKSQVFRKIILPLCKPIIVYTALMAFVGPWGDFMLAKYLIDDFKNYTIAVGLYTMLDAQLITTHFTRFAAGAVLVAVPITVLFLSLQRFFVYGITGGAVKG